MITLPIDGTAGERKCRVEVSVQHQPAGLRLVTNWGNQMLIGCETKTTDVCDFGDDEVLRGILANWHRKESDVSPVGTMTGISILTMPKEQGHDVGKEQAPSKDEGERDWIPEPPQQARVKQAQFMAKIKAC